MHMVNDACYKVKDDKQEIEPQACFEMFRDNMDLIKSDMEQDISQSLLAKSS